MSRIRTYRFPFLVFLTTGLLLAMVQWKVERPIILLERFIENGALIEIPIISIYAAALA